MDDSTLQKINEPQFFTDLCDHITSGGSLPNLCTLLKIKYAYVMRWIYSDPDRQVIYERSLKDRNEWIVQSILNELKEIALVDLRLAYDDNGSLLPPNQWPDGLAKVIQAVEVEELFDGQGENRTQIGYAKRVKLWDKLRALELLGKNLSMFKEQIEHTGKVTLEDMVLGSMLPDTDPPKQLTEPPQP